MRAFVPDRIHVAEHPVSLGGMRFLTRMTVLALRDGLLIHSPIPISDGLLAEIDALGPVRAILAPSTLHHLFVADAQRTFPGVPTYAVVGLAEKRRDLSLQTLDGNPWQGELELVTTGTRVAREVVLYDRATRTVVAVDLVEHFRDETPGTNRALRVLMRLLGMWNKPRPAPELRWMTRDRAAARQAIETILAWDFDRMVIAHGEPFERGAKDALREAWRFVLP